jgi:hypothetical protein
MKGLLICGSLFVNAALVAALVNRPTLAPPPMRDLFGAHTAPAAEANASPKPAAAKQPAPKLWAQLDTTDLRLLKTRLQAAGFPPDIIRRMIVSLVDAQYVPRMRALMQPDPNMPFWKQRGFLTLSDKRYVDVQQLQRERSKLVKDLTADLAAADKDISAAERRRFGDLSAAKIEMVQRIEDDYAEMGSSIRAGMNGIELKEDRDKFALLQKEKEADLASVLTPDELAEYKVRTSGVMDRLRNQLGGFDPSEQEYRAIYQAYDSIRNAVPHTGSFVTWDMEQREAAEQKLGNALKTALGDARYDQFLRTTSSDYQQLARLVQQQNLPADVADRVMTLRDATAQESVRIAQDPGISIPDKSVALKTLAANTRLQLQSLLPGDAGQDYVKRASWLSPLDHDMGVSITPRPEVIVQNDTGGTMSFGNSSYKAVPPTRGHP